MKVVTVVPAFQKMAYKKFQGWPLGPFRTGVAGDVSCSAAEHEDRAPIS